MIILIEQFYNISPTKRYKKSRIRRCVLAALIGLNKNKKLDYVRVLGFSENGAKMLKKNKRKMSSPVSRKNSRF
ncbi:MAG: nucleotidyltransferase family protein [Alistipes sp.]|nr:nucleotidyltransferase family protein [Alistipes sp.]